MRIPAIIIVFLCFVYCAQAQNTSITPLKNFTRSQVLSARDSSLAYLTNQPDNELNYLYPLHQGLGREEVFRKNMGENDFYAAMSQYFAMAGDYKNSLAYDYKTYDKLPPAVVEDVQQVVNNVDKIQTINAGTFVAGLAMDKKVVMINEATQKPLHRAFVFTLLEQFYQQGFRYFAMESLGNFSRYAPDRVNRQTGFYIAEPVAGELVRKALALGYTLIPYEDTLVSTHSITQRDSAQASNLFNAIRADNNARVLVVGGFGHIAEKIIGDNHVPMALAFKKLSGIDPLTIDQTLLSEGSTQEYGRVLYDKLMDRVKITEPVVFLQGKKPWSIIANSGFDLIIIHPHDVYKNNRPTWLSFDGNRKVVAITPGEKNLFLVQAYHATEYDQGKVEQLVPADQTYIPADYGYYDLYLLPGDYKLVFRDAGYKILSVKDKKVN